MQAAHGSFSSGNAPAEGGTGVSPSAMRAGRRSSGGSSGENPSPSQQAAGGPAAAAAPTSWNKVKARIVAETKEQHGAQVVNEPDARLQEWLAEAAAQYGAADAQFQAAKAEFQQVGPEGLLLGWVGFGWRGLLLSPGLFFEACCGLLGGKAKAGGGTEVEPFCPHLLLFRRGPILPRAPRAAQKQSQRLQTKALPLCPLHC